MGVHRKKTSILQKFIFSYVSLVVHSNNNTKNSFTFSSPLIKNSSFFFHSANEKFIHFPAAYYKIRLQYFRSLYSPRTKSRLNVRASVLPRSNVFLKYSSSIKCSSKSSNSNKCFLKCSSSINCFLKSSNSNKCFLKCNYIITKKVFVQI